MATRIMAMPGCRVPDALVISGAGPYIDSWHDFPATSARLAAIVRGLGCSVDVTELVEDALADPHDARLLVVNIGNPADPRPRERMDAAADGLARHLAGGGCLLGVHSSSTSLTGMRQWPEILGGRWVRGTSIHPPLAKCTVSVSDANHPITNGLTDFSVVDERYSYVEVQPGVVTLCEHDFEGSTQPLVWAHEYAGGRVVYDGLGHDVGSYDAPGHVRLIERAVRWLLDQL
jgi:type 1 glutamine amidotransferase